MPPVNWKDHFINFISVILGVTLAFLINSIASSYKQQQEMKLIVLSILEEIQEDIAAYEEYQIPYNKLIIEDIEKTLALIEENGNKDSLQFHFSKAMDVNNYSPSNVTFNSMISSGKLDLLGNFYLRKNLYNYSLSAEEAKINCFA